ncbi:MAG: alanine racemase [Gammaproteobacteria bacterium RIFCSPHIGHO2_12_FULL_41_20]|nr:MAG: alanine racemase [Gammaproteobacteria bacterium RIFCSPHIGHO2_12_FULL_41_20]
MSRPAKLIIDIAALKHNFKKIKQYAPHQAIMAMIKADAYGHGAERVALALTEADAFGVASLEEGWVLRRAGIMQPIVLVEGLFAEQELDEAVKGQFTLVLHHHVQVDMLERASIEKPITVWVKINTGMCRLGFATQDIPDLYSRLMRCPAIAKPMGWMTHFAEADDLHSDTTRQQVAVFAHTVANFPGPRSLANSAGILSWPIAHADCVRPGIMLYGISPFPHTIGLTYKLQPVMTLQAQLIAIHTVKKGSRVGYGGIWTAPEDTHIGVVSAGYGDGYPQFTKNGTPVLVNGKICPLVGRVSMDMLTVDLRSQPEAKLGDVVVLWGRGLPIETIALASDTSAYELVARMTHRPSAQVIG